MEKVNLMLNRTVKYNREPLNLYLKWIYSNLFFYFHFRSIEIDSAFFLSLSCSLNLYFFLYISVSRTPSSAILLFRTFFPYSRAVHQSVPLNFPIFRSNKSENLASLSLSAYTAHYFSLYYSTLVFRYYGV